MQSIFIISLSLRSKKSRKVVSATETRIKLMNCKSQALLVILVMNGADFCVAERISRRGCFSQPKTGKIVTAAQNTNVRGMNRKSLIKMEYASNASSSFKKRSYNERTHFIESYMQTGFLWIIADLYWIIFFYYWYYLIWVAKSPDRNGVPSNLMKYGEKDILRFIFRYTVHPIHKLHISAALTL